MLQVFAPASVQLTTIQCFTLYLTATQENIEGPQHASSHLWHNDGRSNKFEMAAGTSEANLTVPCSCSSSVCNLPASHTDNRPQTVSPDVYCVHEHLFASSLSHPHSFQKCMYVRTILCTAFGGYTLEHCLYSSRRQCTYRSNHSS